MPFHFQRSSLFATIFWHLKQIFIFIEFELKNGKFCNPQVAAKCGVQLSIFCKLSSSIIAFSFNDAEKRINDWTELTKLQSK